MLGWTREELAEQSKVSAAALADFEAEKRTPYDRTLADIRRAFEAAGIEFISENGGGPGVRLREPSTMALTPVSAAKVAVGGKAASRKKPAAKPASASKRGRKK
jgi:transcriptional regulator with XRE-family HTH domain